MIEVDRTLICPSGKVGEAEMRADRCTMIRGLIGKSVRLQLTARIHVEKASMTGAGGLWAIETR
ncbi:MAG: hypothetical protein QOE78_1360 [Alphaproteobacteria bacterium]|nr:hypothetical protein [Alphaproteobacteria bacterium]